mmetsp:Transcript_15950/g.48691  ORF Transcript_15950/g.48691 Transcript_15950/m.48691 type:complete len:237 (+) Transcript_15950:287-997(+)
MFVALVAFTLVNQLSNRMGQSWSSTAAADASDITVVRLNLAVNLPDRRNSVIARLSAVAADRAGGAAGAQGDVFSTKRMGELTSEVCLALLRQRANWQAANFDAAFYPAGNSREAEGAFNKRVIFERSKFEKEEAFLMADDRSDPTLAVVTLVVGVKGGKNSVLQDIARGNARCNVGTVVDLLETVAAESSAAAFVSEDDPERGIVGSEILWTPSTPDEMLGREEVLLDYPELVDF